MHLRTGERILKTYRHHYTPFVLRMVVTVVASIPFFVILFWLQNILTPGQFAIVTIALIAIFALIVIYVSLLYWLDKLVVTNLRVIYVNWKFLTIRDEAEIELMDIEDIMTREKGILSFFGFLDYGPLSISTSSARISLDFVYAPNPEGIRQYIYHLRHP